MNKNINIKTRLEKIIIVLNQLIEHTIRIIKDIEKENIDNNNNKN